MSFAEWQPRYAAVRLALFPVDLEFRDTPDSEVRKKPMVQHWQKMGVRASRSLVAKYSDTRAFGVQCGARYGRKIAVLDVDTTDEQVLRDAIDKHGNSKIIVKTANGKFHIWYSHNGEQRAIRPWEGLPLDVLGGGYVAVPPSQRQSDGKFYQFIQGGLADLDQLHEMRGVDDLIIPPEQPELILPDDVDREVDRDDDRDDGIVRRGRRNDSLFNTLMAIAKTGISAGELLENAMAINRGYDPPLSDGEVMGVANSVM